MRLFLASICRRLQRLLAPDCPPDPLAGMSARDLADLPITHAATDCENGPQCWPGTVSTKS